MNENFADIIKKISIDANEQKKPVNFMTGIVESVQPLTINVEKRITINENNIILTDNVSDYFTWFEFSDSNIKQEVANWDLEEEDKSDNYKISFESPVKHKIKIYNGLKIGEKVLLLRVQQGQMFIVLNRLM